MKNKEQFNKVVANNIARYRKFNNLTQIALADKLNYSDKAVAKWESGESLPDVFVLYQIAEIFGITLNDLLSERKRLKMPSNKIKSILIPIFANCILWLVALVAFIILQEFSVSKAWLPFIVAIPITFILFLIFACIYKNLIVQFLSITGIIWTTILNLHIFLIGILQVASYLYFIGIPIQVAFTLKYASVIIPRVKQLFKTKTKS